MQSIRLIAFGPVDPIFLRDLTGSVNRKFNATVTIGPNLGLPENGFDVSRGQHLAAAFLNTLRAVNAPDRIKLLGITEIDLYSTGLNFVFGQADVGGSASVISLARLYPDSAADGGSPENGPAVLPSLFHERALKEAVHELGHTYGLDHCRDRECVMHFSTGIGDTDIKSADFCPRHAGELEINSRNDR